MYILHHFRKVRHRYDLSIFVRFSTRARIKEFIRVTAAEGAGKWAEREVFRYLARPLCSLVTATLLCQHWPPLRDLVTRDT